MTRCAVRRDLAVLHREPDRIRRLVPEPHCARVAVSTGAEGGGTPTVASLQHHWDAAVEVSQVLCLEVDGPPEALDVVATAVARRAPGTVVAVSMVGAAPPPWWVLDVLIAHQVNVGLDLRDVRWHEDESLWWTTPGGPTLLRLSIEDTSDAAACAKVLTFAAGVASDSPVGLFLTTVGSETVRSDPTMWADVLCAQYASMASDHVAKRCSTGLGGPVA